MVGKGNRLELYFWSKIMPLPLTFSPLGEKEAINIIKIPPNVAKYISNNNSKIPSNYEYFRKSEIHSKINFTGKLKFITILLSDIYKIIYIRG